MTVQEPDRRLQELELRRESHCEPSGEALGVIGLRSKAGQSPEPLLRVEHPKEVDERDVPARVSAGELGLQRKGRSPVAAPCIEKDQCDVQAALAFSE